MPIANANILRVVAKLDLDGNDIQNVYHVRTTVSADPGDTTTLLECATWLDDAYAQINGMFDQNIIYVSVAVWNLSTDTFIGEGQWPVLAAGISVTDMMPPQCAPLVLFNTNTNRSQGRKFLPPLTEGNLDADGTPTAGTLSAILAYSAAILSGITGTGWTGEPGNYNVDLVRFVPWAYAVVKDMFATQRRRYRGKGS